MYAWMHAAEREAKRIRTSMLRCHGAQGFYERVHGGQEAALERGLEHERVAHIVDIFACARKVREL
jgi:hypothetical protein